MKAVLLYLWQLPQNLCGIVLYLIVRRNVASVSFKANLIRDPEGALVHSAHHFRGGVSLGRYLFVHCASEKFIGSPVTIAHEYGHHLQSRRLGWLYLPTVGLVSGLRAGLKLYRKGHYYDRWPENEADRLGGVKRTTSGVRYV